MKKIITATQPIKGYKTQTWVMDVPDAMDDKTVEEIVLEEVQDGFLEVEEVYDEEGEWEITVAPSIDEDMIFGTHAKISEDHDIEWI